MLATTIKIISYIAAFIPIWKEAKGEGSEMPHNPDHELLLGPAMLALLSRIAPRGKRLSIRQLSLVLVVLGLFWISPESCKDPDAGSAAVCISDISTDLEIWANEGDSKLTGQTAGHSE